jgi:transcriptional regulator with XRE-family HTH domain
MRRQGGPFNHPRRRGGAALGRISLAALADQAGIGKGYLLQIENGERTGMIDTMKKLAGALGLELDDLV